MKKFLLFFILPLIICFIWFHKMNLIASGEDGLTIYFPFINNTILLPISTGFAAFDYITRLPISYFFSLAYLTHIPLWIFQAVVFYLLMTTSLFSMYFLTVTFLDRTKTSELIGVISAIFYLFNPFSMSQIWDRGLYSQYFIFAGLPLFTLLFVLGLKSQRYSYILYFGFASFLFSTAFGIITNIIVLWSVLFIYLIIHYFFIKNKNKSTIVYICVFSLGCFLSWVLVSAWWFFPFLGTINGLYGDRLHAIDNVSSLIGVSKYFPLTSVIRLVQNFYFFDTAGVYGTTYSFPIFQVISLLIPCFFMLGFTKIINKKRSVFFAVICIVSLFVSLGANPPFDFIFLFIFNHVPFLQAFRNPYEKYGIVFVLGYSFIFANGLVIFVHYLKTKNITRKFAYPTIVIILICIFGVYLWPMWTGSNKTSVTIPEYYQQTAQWLSTHTYPDDRILTTPLVGEGSTQQWGTTTYRGIDATSYLLRKPAVSYLLNTPYIFDFVSELRKELGVSNVVPALSLLDVKDIIARKDFINEDNNQEKYFVGDINVPDESHIVKICDMVTQVKTADAITNQCFLTEEEKKLQNTQYLRFIVRSSIPSSLGISITDKNGQSKSWDSSLDQQFLLPDKSLHEITINLYSEEQSTVKIYFPDITQIRITASPLHKGNTIKGFSLENASALSYKKQQLHEFHLDHTNGNLVIYSPISYHPAPLFGLLSQVKPMHSLSSIFSDVASERLYPQVGGYAVISQNKDKDLSLFTKELQNTVVSKKEISQTRYYMRLANTGPTYVLLSKTFTPLWKIIPNVKESQMKDSLVNDITLLSMPSLAEKNHIVGNGYANLWNVSGANSYGIIFLPQVYADLGMYVSLFSIGIIFLCSFFIILKNIKKK